jgi:membrane-associated phospholipid phosphatase
MQVWRKALTEQGPGVVLVWGLAVGIWLWALGLDIGLMYWLESRHVMAVDVATRVLGEVGKGTFQASACLLVGLMLAAQSRGRATAWLLGQGARGVFQQFWLLIQGKMQWASAWKPLPFAARAWLLCVPVFLLAGLVNVVLKMAIGRPRPKELLWNGVAPYDMEPFGLDAGWWSFPSGHAVSTFAIAVILAYAFPRYKALILAVAGVFAASRFLAVTPHYLGDVVAGCAVGAAVGLTVAKGMKLRG